MGSDQGDTYGKSESPCAVFSPAVSIDLPPSMYLETSDGTEFISKAFHFHWGGRDWELSGSEHTIDGIRSIMEVCDSSHRVSFPSRSRVTFFVSVSACLLYTCHVCAHACECACTHVCVLVEARD